MLANDPGIKTHNDPRWLILRHCDHVAQFERTVVGQERLDMLFNSKYFRKMCILLNFSCTRTYGGCRVEGEQTLGSTPKTDADRPTHLGVNCF